MMMAARRLSPSHAIMLAFRGSVINLAAAPQGNGSFEGVMRLTLVQAELGAALQGGISNPAQHEKGAFNAADFTQCERQVILR